MPLYNIKEAAKAIGRHPSAIKRWERGGKIPPAKRDASTNYRIYTDEDIQMIRNRMRIGQIISPKKVKPRKKK